MISCCVDVQRDYLYYEKRYGDSRNRRCIDGKITGCGKCVGYCQYTGHSGYLTDYHRREHNCIEKGCVHYLPKMKVLREQPHENLAEQHLTALARELTTEYEGMRVMSVAHDRGKGWTVKYVTITNEYPIETIERKLSEVSGEAVAMCKLDYDFERAATLIFMGHQ